MMTKMSKPRLLTGALMACALLTTACSTVPDGPLSDDQMVFQVCLRAKPMSATRQLDFTIVRTDRRDIEPTMPVGRSVKDQPIFEAVAGGYANIKTTLLSVDRKVWYGFDVPDSESAQAPHLGLWSDWQPVGFVSSTEGTLSSSGSAISTTSCVAGGAARAGADSPCGSRAVSSRTSPATMVTGMAMPTPQRKRRSIRPGGGGAG